MITSGASAKEPVMTFSAHYFSMKLDQLLKSLAPSLQHLLGQTAGMQPYIIMQEGASLSFGSCSSLQSWNAAGMGMSLSKDLA